MCRKVMQRIFQVILASVLVSGSISISVCAEDSTEGIYENLSYKACSDHVTITGCDKTVTTVVIPAEIEHLPVTEIGGSSFANCAYLTEISIPDSVTLISSGAFSKCTSLENIMIPDSVTEIAADAFVCGIAEITVSDGNQNYSSVDGVLFNKEQTMLIDYPEGSLETSYHIPDGVTEIASGAFSDCRNLQEIIMPDSVIVMQESACKACSNLKHVTLSENLMEISDQAFYFCRNLEEISFPDGITKIGESAFASCGNLTDLIIPDSVTEIGRSAFEKCRSLKHVTILNPDCEISDDAKTIPAATAIHGYLDSTAYFYEVNHNPFISLGEYLKIQLVQGDLTGDEQVSVTDLVKMQKYLLGQENISAQLWKNADLDQNHIVNVYDLILLKKEILKNF